MKLSILICSLHERQYFLAKMLDNLKGQLGEYLEEDGKIISEDVEIIISTDGGEMRVGDKRNLLLSKAIGDYIVFVDDDDRVSKDYVKYLLAGIATDSDIIVFDLMCSLNGGEYKPVIYDVNFIKDQDYPDRYERIPNHIMCWKKSIIKSKFPSINRGEDAEWAKRNKRHIKSEARIDKVLYWYDFNQKTTRTQ